ncbi:MAG: hypothetical protein AAF628_23455 [Planctomycetota bacterium]
MVATVFYYVDTSLCGGTVAATGAGADHTITSSTCGDVVHIRATAPDGWQVGDATLLYDSLNNFQKTTLTNSGLPFQGDHAAVFSWTFRMGVGGFFRARVAMGINERPSFYETGTFGTSRNGTLNASFPPRPGQIAGNYVEGAWPSRNGTMILSAAVANPPLGVGGATLYVDPGVAMFFPLATTRFGDADFQIQIPDVSALIGPDVYSQFVDAQFQHTNAVFWTFGRS